MAEKRMFSRHITDTDAFLEMPLSSQALYFHMNMHADDDGFVSNPRRLARLVGASDDDLRILVVKRFVIAFDNTGVMVIKHWRMHNTLRSDRYRPTEYVEELRMIGLKSNKSYTDDLTNKDIVEYPVRPVSNRTSKPVEIPEAEANCLPSGNQLATNWQPVGNQLATSWQPSVATDKNSIEESSIDSDKNSIEESLILSNERICRTKDVRLVVKTWNGSGLKPIRGIQPDSARGAMTRKRIIDFGIDAVLEAIAKVKESKFLAGDNNKGWVATYDWFIRPSNFQKCLEGNYDDRNISKGSGKLGFMDLLKEDGVEFN